MAAQETKTGTEAAPQEKQTNCISCNKPIKRVRQYYRNGKYYCTKKCWKKMLEKAKEGKDGQNKSE